jgi:hypothetical protein
MVRIDLEPPTPRDPFYRRPARDLPLVRRADSVPVGCETRLARSPPPLASRLLGGLRSDGSARAAAARSQARPRCVRALSSGHLRAAPCAQGARYVGSDAREGVRAASLALGTRSQGSPDRRWHARSFESADALRSVSPQQERSRAQRASGENPGAWARRAGPLAGDSFGFDCGATRFRSGIALLAARWPSAKAFASSHDYILE